MSVWQVTVKSGLKDVVLPDGLRYQGGAVVMLSDEQVSRMSQTSFVSILNSVAPILLNSTSATPWPAGGL